MQLSERAYKGICRFVVGTEQSRFGVLDQVAVCPWLSSRHTNTQRAFCCRQVKVDRCPIPTGVEFDLLSLAAIGGQHKRFVVAAAIYKSVREENILAGCQVIQLAGRCLPELEMNQLESHIIVTEHSQIDIGGIAYRIERNVRLSHALVVIKSINDIPLIGIIHTAVFHSDLHLGADGHTIRVLSFVNVVVRLNSLDYVLDTQRFA